MPDVRIGDTVIGFEDRGAGPALLLLPGLGLDRSVWAAQVERFSADHRVIALDPCGAGGSSPLRGWRNVLSRQAADIGPVLDRLGVERAVVCGVSYGGVLAQRFALDAPDRVAGLVTVDSFADTRPRSPAEAANLALLYATGWLWLFPGLLRPGIRHQYARWPHALRRLEAGLAEMRRMETVKIRYALNRVDHLPELSALDCPVLAVAGDSPWLVPMSRRIAEAVPDGRLAVVEDSFDPSNLCRPEEFDRILAGFLDGIGW
ncbi:alpha/beta fold hydrolase [Nocardiopsis potens]|uniref:alpha/beta fold hydrolase n=1 Tax=Nocardiopsis potens TaxID=1246458 RepID=UPI00034D35BC|nr:alpha/beta fold hydrolase [Nocardiopsis potens]